MNRNSPNIAFLTSFLFYIFSLAFPHSSMALPPLKPLQASLWPRQTYLGRTFIYRAELPIQGSFQPLRLLLPSSFPAHRRGHIILRASSRGLIVRIPFAIYAVRQFGKQQLPSFSLLLQGKKKTIKLLLPSLSIKIRARYAQNAPFHEQNASSQLIHLAPKQGEPIHDFAMLKFHQNQTTSQLFWGIGIILLLIFLLLFRYARLHFSNKTKNADPPLSPYERFQKMLEMLQRKSPSTEEERRSLCRDLAKELRLYLEARLSLPATSMTAQELLLALSEPEHPAITELVNILQESEERRFSAQLPDNETIKFHLEATLKAFQALETHFRRLDELKEKEISS